MNTSKKTKRVAIAFIKDKDGNILFGRRNDNNKYTNPGGHLHNGEDPYIGMVREIKEEAGLDAQSLKLIKTKFIPKSNILVYLFEVEVDPNQKIDVSKDPDKEVSHWEYLDPFYILNELHVPIERNTVIEHWVKN